MDDKKPTILQEGEHTLSDLKNLEESCAIWAECDVFTGQLRELFEITHPQLIGTAHFDAACTRFIEDRTAGQNQALKGAWIYFPWNGRLVHMVGETDYFNLRTNRNRNLITQDEQYKLNRFCVGIIGLSVGSNVATALSYAGIAGIIKLAEFDTLETTNLNRIRARVDQIGVKKLEVAAQQVYEINPFAKLHFFSEGIDKETLINFVVSEPKPQLIFEIIDAFELKIHIRALAREHGIPVIMITNLGDRVLMDVERYDLDRGIDYFNGRAGKVPHDILEHPDRTNEDKHRYAVELAGVEYIPQRAMDSVKEIKKTLVGRPQLASTVIAASAFSTYLTRKIVLGEKLPSSSWLVDFDRIFAEKMAL